MGRHRRKNFVIRIRYFEEAVLDAKKDESEMKTSEYIRNLILTASPYERPRYTSEVAETLQRELSHIGAILTTISSATNKQRKISPYHMQMLNGEFLNLLALYDVHVRGQSVHSNNIIKI